MQETGFNPWVRKITWRRKWQTHSIFLSEKYHEQRSLMDCSPLGRKELNTTEQLNTHIENISSARMFQIVSLSWDGWEDWASLFLQCQKDSHTCLSPQIFLTWPFSQFTYITWTSYIVSGIFLSKSRRFCDYISDLGLEVPKGQFHCTLSINASGKSNSDF